MEIAVVGTPEFVIGFRLAGVRKTFEVGEKELVPTIQKVLEDKTVGILVIHANHLAKLPPALAEVLDESVSPTVISIGGKGESSNIREKIKQAVGVDLWK